MKRFCRQLKRLLDPPKPVNRRKSKPTGIIGFGGLALSLAHASDDSLWIGADDGLVRIVNGKGELINFPRKHREFIFSLTCTSNNAVWVVTSHSNLLRYQNNEWTSYRLQYFNFPSKHVYKMVETADGTLWAETDSRIYVFHNNKWSVSYSKHPKFPSHHVHLLKGTPDGALWAITPKGLIRYHNGQPQTYKNDLVTKDSYTYIKFLQTDDGHIWLGADTALWCGKLSGDKLQKITGPWENYKEIPSDQRGYTDISHLLQTSDGAIWIAGENGVHRFKNNNWESFTTANGVLPEPNVSGMVETNDGTLWIAPYCDHGYSSSGILSYKDGCWKTHTSFPLAEDVTPIDSKD